MKKHLYLFACALFVMIACNKEDDLQPVEVLNPEMEAQALANETVLTTLFSNVLAEAVAAEDQVPEGEHAQGTQFQFSSVCPAVSYISGFPAVGIPHHFRLNFGQYCQLSTGAVVSGIVDIYSFGDLGGSHAGQPSFMNLGGLVVNGCKVDVIAKNFPYGPIQFYKKPSSVNTFLFFMQKPDNTNATIIVQGNGPDGAGGKTQSFFFPPTIDNGFQHFLTAEPDQDIYLNWSSLKNATFTIDLGSDSQPYWDANTKYYPDYNVPTASSDRIYKVGINDADRVSFSIGESNYPCGGTLEIYDGVDVIRGVEFSKTYEFGYVSNGTTTTDCATADHTRVTIQTRPAGSTGAFQTDIATRQVYPD